ncbi:MAG: hypothetical protein JWN04_5819 [Myxococcaceae bacterium]|nr:hypothetical protein [Myxococcaceae bacterium]
MTDKRPLVFVPTYNERENAERLCHEILALGIELDILFIDDNSTDGTGEILDRLSAEHPNVSVIHRAGKLGIGSAHYAGIQHAYAMGYEQLITMDCDFTHSPHHIPEFLEKSDQGYEVVVASRFMQDKSLAGWNLYRKALSHTGHLVTQVLLDMPFDATGAYRCYRLTAIPQHAFDLVSSKGYAFFFESLYILHKNGLRIAEIPVLLPNRTYGHSKMDSAEIRRSVELLVTTCVKATFNPEKFEIAEPLDAQFVDSTQQDEQGWDAYWENQKTKAGGLAYDAVASFYRKFIIRRSLNKFVDEHFAPGSRVLHAGCGSGQVDTDIRSQVHITGLDISVNALNFYKKTNREFCEVLHGSIFKIPLPDGSLDGVYNLGVMEHFTEDEIGKILREFHRVLRPGGKMLLFWPPEFGLSVLFFKALTVIFRDVLGKENVKFHPDEITRIRSRRHLDQIFRTDDLKVVRYYFGPRDLFTYAVIVVEKSLSTQPRAELVAAGMAGS